MISSSRPGLIAILGVVVILLIYVEAGKDDLGVLLISFGEIIRTMWHTFSEQTYVLGYIGYAITRKASVR
jgi:hypothetical protein